MSHVKTEDDTTPAKPLVSNGAYDAAKNVAQYWLPAAGTLYFALATIWGLPYGEQVVGTITAVDVFLAVLLGISTKVYNASDAKYDGALHVDTTLAPTDPNAHGLEFAAPLGDLATQKEITLKVIPHS